MRLATCEDGPMSNFFAFLGRSRKAIAALVGAVLVWCQAIAAQPGGFQKITAVEWVALAVALATALGVYAASNDPTTPKFTTTTAPEPTHTAAELPPAIDAVPPAV